ncbi:PQQ-binding-like beta-propeller repeat protein [Streptomyces sp. MBT62]|uniref:protein kinase domain-containing protein n=1 Tax=Streptomyces sp. MBT62 TaxID=2800410 RepID=UPI00190D15E8|nr:protein kinase [Streptomyces sp. MBT62]MBK3567032.1 protein kinase [Streptomyces sp. MBT62]
MNPLGTGDPIRLGPYRLLGVIGEGGMGKVYLGQDGPGTLAAVKVLRPELAYDTELAQRFVREAQAAQAVRGKGVAAVLEARTEGARPWIASEFLAGLTLAEAVEAHGPLTEPALRALGASLADTLADIHAAGFIHRDLKPPNIVLTSDGPRVIDFGIARPEHGLTLTTTGQAPVTPGYGAPEQVLGQRVTPAADVFSLGAVLAYALTGQRAFEGSHVAVVQYAVVHGEPRLDGVELQLRALVEPCLAKDPAARPQPAEIVRAMDVSKRADRVWKRGRLADSIKERESGARRMTTETTAQLPSERRLLTRRRLITGLSTTGVVLAAGGGTTAWLLGSSDGGRSVRLANSPFTVPPAVPTPTARMAVVADKASGSLGRPTGLWALENAADVYSPYLLPVRDVLVFGAASGGIVAYGVKDGRRRWSAPRVVTKSGYLSLSDRLVVGTDSQGALRTYVPSTGEAKWTCPGAEAAQLLGADAESVYVITKDDRLRSVRRADAKVGWTATVPADFRKKVFAPAAVGPGRLVMGTTDGNFLAVDTSNGRMAWNRLDHVPIGLRPAVRGDTVYLGGYTLEAVRIADGERIWSVKPHGDLYRERWGPVTVSGNRLYATEGIYPRRLDPRDGSQLWSGYSESAGTALYAGRALPQGHAVWSIDKSVVQTAPMELDAAKAVDGGRLWRYEFPRTDYTRLAADGNRVFLMHDSKVVALTTF